MDGLFQGGGEIRARCRAVDWGATSLGPVESWPPALRAAVLLCLESQTTIAIWAGPDFVLLHNEGYASVLGGKAAWALGRPAREVWSEVWDLLGPELQQVVEEGVATRHEDARFRLRRNGGDEDAFFTYSLTPIRDDDGRVLGAFNVLEETTARVRQRIQRESIFSAVVEGTPDLIAAVDTDLKFLAFNHAYAEEWRRIWGFEPEPGVSLVDALATRPEQQRRALALFRQALAGETVTAIEEFGDPSRSRGTYGLRFSALRDADGRIIGSAQIGRDITEQQQDQERLRAAKQQLEEADRRKDHFLAILSHELRNPLTPIRNGLFILERASPGGVQARHAQEIIARQVELLSRLVDDLLDVTRIARGKIRLQRRRLELNELVRRTVDDHRALMERSGLALHLEVAPDDVYIDADWNRVAQVLGNLLQNAAKFTLPGGHVRVQLTTDPAAQQAVLQVTDTGRGMEPGLVARLFEPFMQAEETLDRTKGGLGLGLALVKGLVEQHGGQVTARSEGLGRGSEFEVRLPLDRAAAPARERSPLRAAAVRRRVLIIEDNADAAQSLGEVLKLLGHEVAIAGDGPEGIARARDVHPELVLCDIGLPGMDGYAVARAFRADPELRAIRLVALTGYALPEDLRLAADAGFEQHVTKPPSLETLERVLHGPPGE